MSSSASSSSSDSSRSSSNSSSSGSSSHSDSSGGGVGLVLVTGGTGFIACHVARELLQSGYHVRATARDISNKSKLQALTTCCREAKDNLEVVQADLLDPNSWSEALEDVTHVCHVASPFPDTQVADENELIRPAREGTLNVLRAAHDAGGVKRVVLTSSIAAIYAGVKGNTPEGKNGFTEEDWSDIHSKTIDAYSKSKTLAEQAAWEYVKESKSKDMFELVVLNPGFVLGPAIHGKSCTSMVVVRKMLLRESPAVPDLSWNIVDVRDVATAHVKALTTPGINGERFCLVADLRSMRQLCDVLRKEFGSQGYKPPSRKAPYCLLWCLSKKDKNVKAVLSRVGRKPIFSTNKASATFGIKYINPDESCIAMASSYIQLSNEGKL